MPQWLLMDVLRDVSNGEVHQVCLLVTKMGELSLVRGNDHGDDRSPWLECLKTFLRTVIRTNFISFINCIPECSTTIHLYTFHYRSGNSGLDRYSVIWVQIWDLEQIVGCCRAIKYILAHHMSRIQGARYLGWVPFIRKGAGQVVPNLLWCSTCWRCGTTVQEYL